MPGMLPEDVYQLTGVSDPRVSPDGLTIAYVVTRIDRDANAYRSGIWLADPKGVEPVRQFTSGTKRDVSPRWSPDGSRIAFCSTRDGDAAQLYVIAAAGGEAKRLTDLKEDVEDLQWSPDGTKIVFTARTPDEAYSEEDERKRAPRRVIRLCYKLDNVGWTVDRRRHVFTVAADGSTPPAQLTKGEFDHDAPTWSPDGTRIAFASGRHEDWDLDLATDIYIADASGGEPELLTTTDGYCAAPSFSPDGRRIAYLYTPGLFDEPRHGQIAVIDLPTKKRSLLTTSLDRQCAPYPFMREPIWDGDDILFAVEDGGRTHLYRTAGGGSPTLVVGGETVVSGYDARSGTIAHAAATFTNLYALFVGERLLDDPGASFLATKTIGQTERFTATSADGTEVDCWIVRPADFDPKKKYPVLLNIHGGPFAQYGVKFFDEFQVYAGAGYAVVFCNPRGSSGYSEEFGRAIRGPVSEGPGWGSVDHEDCIAAIDTAVKNYSFCDPERLGVMGGSYGGYMTSWIIGHDHRFKAAISERSVNSFVSEFGSSDYGQSFKGYTGAHVYENVEAHLKISPSTYAENIKTPLLILHSEKDLRCNIEQGEHLFAILRLLKRDVEFVRFPAESHELSRSGSPLHRVMRFEVVLDWLKRYLTPDA